MIEGYIRKITRPDNAYGRNTYDVYWKGLPTFYFFTLIQQHYNILVRLLKK